MADPVFRSAYDFLAPSPDATYGTGPAGFFAQNRPGSAAWVQEGDNTRLSIPDWLRTAMRGVVGLGESTQSGTLSGDALKVLTTVGPGTGSVLAPRGSLGVFGGPMSRRADIEALQKAKYQTEKGYYPDEVWEGTGWGRGVDNKWRYEINDQPAKANIPPGAGPEIGGKLAGILHHKELYDAYPELRNITVSFSDAVDGAVADTVGRNIVMNPRYLADPEKARNVLLHEVQHFVQNREGFAPGGSAENLDLYRRTAGEVEARDVEHRSMWGRATRRETPPEYSQDVPSANQIVRGFNVREPTPPGFRVANDMVF